MIVQEKDTGRMEGRKKSAGIVYWRVTAEYNLHININFCFRVLHKSVGLCLLYMLTFNIILYYISHHIIFISYHRIIVYYIILY